MNSLESLRAAMSGAGLRFAGQFQIDDELHHFDVPGEKGEASWYAAHYYGEVIVANFGCFRRGLQQTWTSRNRDAMSKEEWGETSRKWKELEVKRAEDEKRKHAAAAERCRSWFARFPRAEGHIYLAVKDVPALGPLYLFTDELFDGWLALPLQDSDGVIHSAQFIADDGTKEYCYGGRKKGCFYPVSEVPGGPILICEGYATGASLFLATGWTVICALDCGNLLPVAQSFRKKFPQRTIVLCADNDQFKGDFNPGVDKASAAAKAVSGRVSVPSFSDEALANKPTDFNDLHANSGLDEVRRQIYDALPIVGRPIGILVSPPKDDPTELLKYRYLCERGGLLFNGPTGVGKSSISIQQSACWCNGLPFFGIAPRKPLKIVVIQAENDDGDVAQMRDGICTGLELTREQRAVFFERCIIHTATRGITGRAFCLEIVRPLLDLHAPHMLHIDPALSFVGGDVKEQRIVGEFLRAHLNPELYDHQCACELFHHTNKPLVGKEKANWVNGEWAYSGSGSAEFANWARAVLALQSLGVPGYYQLHAGKRGGRLGWSAESDENAPIYKKPIAWANQKGLIYWRTPDPSEIPAERAAGRPPSATITPQALLDILSNTPMTTKEWKQTAADELGIGKSYFYDMVKNLETNGLVVQSLMNKRWSVIKSKSRTNDN